MKQLLIARETIITFFKRYETFILPVVKFFLGVFIFHKINTVGYVGEWFAPYMETASALPLTMLLGVAFALLPFSVSYFLMILNITLQFSASLEVMAVVFLFLLCILLFYARMAAKESILIILTVIACYYNVSYLVPLVAGLYFSLTAIIPVAIGVFIYEFIPVAHNLMATTKTAGLDLTEMPASFTEVYTSLQQSLATTHGWIYTAFVFAMVIILVYVVSRLAIDFSKDIAILLGCVMNIFGYILAVLVAGDDISILGVIIGTLLCGALAMVIRFFDAVLDYQRAESVQFEDENNYYYVRVIPKVIMTKRKRVVRRIRPQPEDEE